MKYEDLGYDADFANHRKNQQLESFGLGRVISEHKERYVVKTTKKEYDGEIIGNLRFSVHDRSDLPAVGDWVAISEYDENKALIHSVFPRKTILERQAVGKQTEKQIIATNVDYAFIVQAVDRDFNINRIERYLTICYTSGVKPIIILNKIDLVNDTELANLITSVQERIKQVPIIAISNENQKGIEKLKKSLEKGKTYCLLGSSGVGKSSLINNLSGEPLMKTNTISTSSNKGRHITSHRELLVLENGGILIDNPGMREIGIADSTDGIEKTFEKIALLSKKCKFKNCTHTTEADCAVLAALQAGKLNESLYKNFLKMQSEKDHFESTVAEKRKKDMDFGKMIKNYKKNKKMNRY
ncbi:MAG: ribosome small subunit-dependent GTPase A [Bacteroidetes bacterium]|nr:ribosome small subunit-dependent GTPase A [Bacteroidota bacterium]MBT6686384.1 ribosome small subunit-dependent GTPase A [Bacteroidota bacterium]MBT7142217.1 ribosome small subunit-dependent GTPase A [Bacteroidota bacterium]MBT7490428.1 ribosome small subunit-dependent GTPase A [Bacteroidota bacterium]